MKCHLMSLGWKVWETTEKEYKIDDQAPTDPDELGQYEGNSKSLNEILSGLTNSIFTKVMRCKNSKQAWDKLIFMKEHLKSKNPSFKHIKGILRALK